MKNLTIKQLEEQNLIIFSAIVGSRAYGTSTIESDTDIRGVFIQPLNHILKWGFIEQISDEKNDIIFYELSRFIDLLQKNNPNILEMISIPPDCIISKSTEFSVIEGFKDKWLTKKVRETFAGYAINQIQKSRGYNKKMNWEEVEMKRKTVLDFCYVLSEGGSVSFKEWLKTQPSYHSQKDYGLVSIDHAHDIYAIYLTSNSNWGIVSDEETANDVKLTSIPKGVKHFAYLSFNKSGYSSHCIKYKEYQTWLKERNPNRVRMNKEHGKQYDSKNLAHCIRLLDTAIEILETQKINVRRSPEQITQLMSIRRGEMEYEDILKMAENKISYLDEAFEKSDLLEEVDSEFVSDILLSIRKFNYKL